MFPQEIIIKKRDNRILNKDEINFFINGVANGSISDCQIGAFTMAVFLNSLEEQELVNLTLAMRDSGNVLKWNLDAPIIDKHSTGGVGDKLSLMLAPILACFPAYIPMLAGRGLGHTGGTLDKLDSIPGYTTSVSPDKFQQTVKNVGCAIVGQTADLAPADKKMYAIRDVSGTVESIPLITASILSKKLAAGLEYLVMDIKCGNGAFMKDYESSKLLAETIVKTANNAGTKTSAVLTDMNSVLGTTVGNSLELIEAVKYLKDENRNLRVDMITKELASELLVNANIVSDKETAKKLIEEKIISGQALEKFAKMVFALGGPIDFCEKYTEYLSIAPIKRPLFAQKQGYISSIDTYKIGMALIALKGGRTAPTQQINHTTGFTDFCQIGDFIDNQTPLATIHAQTEEDYLKASEMLLEAINITDTKPITNSPILKIIA